LGTSPLAPGAAPAPAINGTPSPRFADESLKDGIDRMKDTAKWLIVCFGVVVNAFILAGIGLGNLGEVHGHRLAIAIAAIAAAIIAVTVGIISASSVLASGQVTLTDLKGPDARTKGVREELDKSQDLFPGYGSINEFAGEMTRAADEQATALRSLYSLPPVAEDDPTRVRLEAEYENANEKVRTFRPYLERLLLLACFTDVQRHLHRCRRVIAGCFLTVVSAATIFALATDKGGSRATFAAAPRLAFVRIDFTPSGERRFRSRLGARCDFDNVTALVLGGSDHHVSLLTLPRSSCKAVQLSVDGLVADVEPIDLPEVEIR
jgi:hypothetical protein